MANYWENSCSFGLRYVSWYKCLIVSLGFSHLGFWSGNLFLIAPFPDLCLLVPFYTSLANQCQSWLVVPPLFTKLPCCSVLCISFSHNNHILICTFSHEKLHNAHTEVSRPVLKLFFSTRVIVGSRLTMSGENCHRITQDYLRQNNVVVKD